MNKTFCRSIAKTQVLAANRRGRTRTPMICRRRVPARLWLALLPVLAGLPLSGQRSIAELPCAILSTGAETDAGTGSIQNLGQAVIGRAGNGSVQAHIGGIACLSVHVSCLLGDVNGDGLIDGLDIDHYVRVNLSGIGTPRELCASAVDVPGFTALLLQ